MKSAFSYNLLKHLRAKKAEGGFTLIELLVVIIIIGILAAIALPSFLNQANRARETEATNAVGALNRGQQAYYLEKVYFAGKVTDLDVGVDTDTENFTYGSGLDGTTIGDFATKTVGANEKGPQGAGIYAAPVAGIRGFAGAAYTISVNDKNQTTAILCRENATQAKDGGVAAAIDTTDFNDCGGLEQVN